MLYALCFPGMSESTFISGRFIQFIHRMPVNFFNRTHNHLGDAITRMNRLFRIRKIYQYHFQFPAIISIDRAWRIQTGNSLFESQTAPGPYLGFISRLAIR